MQDICICCGENYFTEKTISMFPQGFDIDNAACSGSEQTGNRTVLIIQNNKANEYAHTTIIAIVTSKIKNYITTQ